MTTSVSLALVKPILDEVLGQEAEPILQEFVATIQGASQTLIAKLPAGAQGIATVGSSTLISIAALLAQNEVNVLLAHNTGKAKPSTAAPDPVEAPAPPAEAEPPAPIY